MGEWQGKVVRNTWLALVSSAGRKGQQLKQRLMQQK